MDPALPDLLWFLFSHFVIGFKFHGLLRSWKSTRGVCEIDKRILEEQGKKEEKRKLLNGLFPFFDVGIDGLPRLFGAFDLVMTLEKSL